MTPNPNPSPELRALADIFEHFEHSKQAPGHCHDVPGIWDADNGPDKAGKPCEWCAKWERARAVLASPQTLPAPGGDRTDAQLLRLIAKDHARLAPNAYHSAETLVQIADRIEALATVAAANDEGVRSARVREAIDAGLRAFCSDTSDFTMSSAMRRAAADFIMGEPGMFPLATSRSQHEGAGR